MKTFLAAIRIIHIVLSYLLLPYLFTWYFFVAMNAFRAGYYPYSPDHPPVYLFGTDSYLEVMSVLFGIAFFSIPSWFVYSLVVFLFDRYRLGKKHLLVFFISGAVFLFHFSADPAFAWYVD